MDLTRLPLQVTSEQVGHKPNRQYCSPIGDNRICVGLAHLQQQVITI